MASAQIRGVIQDEELKRLLRSACKRRTRKKRQLQRHFSSTVILQFIYKTEATFLLLLLRPHGEVKQVIYLTTSLTTFAYSHVRLSLTHTQEAPPPQTFQD